MAGGLVHCSCATASVQAEPNGGSISHVSEGLPLPLYFGSSAPSSASSACSNSAHNATFRSSAIL
jgi:hypothetical protein